MARYRLWKRGKMGNTLVTLNITDELFGVADDDDAIKLLFVTTRGRRKPSDVGKMHK